MITVLFMLYALNEITPIPTHLFVIAWILYAIQVLCNFYAECKDK